MKKTIFLSLFSILFPLYENLVTLQNEVLCEDVDLIKFIEFPYDRQKCLEVVFDRHNKLICSQKLFGLNTISLKTTSFKTLKYRDIRSEVQDKCETFLIFAGSIVDVNKIFKSYREDGKQFFPFSKIYFHISGNFTDSEATSDDSSAQLRTFLLKNALFGYIFDYSNEKILIRDLLTNDLKRSISSYTPSDLFHPTVDTRLAKDNFRISLFNCKPFTFYRENASYDTIINEMDGIEFRFVKEVTRNWNKTFNLRDFSRTKLSPYSVMVSDIANRSSDLAMCSIWLKNYPHYEITTYYLDLCTTFMVPKPKKLHEATAVYTALDQNVWMLFLCVFLLSSISLNFASKIEKSLLKKHEASYTDFSSALLDTISIVSSHSVYRFPSNVQVSAQIVLTSWILFSMSMDICYTTIYTSRLTSPSYEKPINTVKQFLDHDLYFCGSYISDDSIKQFSASINEDYRKLSTRAIVYGENQLYKRQLLTERKCGIFVGRISKNCIFLQKENENLVPTFRLMEDCVFSHLSGFAFQKYSPYVKLFNWHIRRYQEHGIIRKWHLDYSSEQKNFKTLFFDRPDPGENVANKINLVNLSGSFFLLGTGLVLATISFCVEIIIAALMN